MTDQRETLISFVAAGSSPDEWRLVLVEGPWQPPFEAHLRRLQERLLGCVDAALDGQLMEQFPATHGKAIVVQVDCYNVPEIEARAFFDAFADGIFRTPDYRDALAQTPFVAGISFEISFERIH